VSFDPTLGARFLLPLLVGMVVALLMSPLHGALARRRRQALLIDRVVTGRVARLTGPERRRAIRHLHAEAGHPVSVVAGLALASGAVTLVGAVITARATVGSTDRRAVFTRLFDQLDAAGLPTPSSSTGLVVVTVVLGLLLALAVGTLHVATLDLERRRAMPVTRPWPWSKRRVTWLAAGVVMLVLLAVGIQAGGLAAGLFLLGHQLTARATRPRACTVAPVLPEALRAARLPGPKGWW
jgi:hypothetical protein